MSFGCTKSVVVDGIDGTVVEVEVSVTPGLPRVVISGLPDSAVAQAPERLRAAMIQSELPFPDQRVTINLAPASIRKAGAGLDLGMAVGILATSPILDVAEVRQVAHLGELGMDGSVRPVHGVLPACMAAVEARLTDVVVPFENAHEASLVEGLSVHPVRALSDVVAFHRARARGDRVVLPWPEQAYASGEGTTPDMADIVGQYEARNALEIAAAGGHNLSMVGPPGAGKTLLASRLPGILPALTREEALIVTSIQSVLGLLGDSPLIERAPFIAPHHNATVAAMVGGGSARPRPGAISQAHAGVLFLDEVREFGTAVLESLRQPLENGFVTVARARNITRYPSRFQLVVASNPCPCGRYVGNGAGCSCTVDQRRRYDRKLSGPLLDRIDVHLQVEAVTRADLAQGPGEPSSVVADRVRTARERAASRWAPMGYRLNAEVPGAVLRSQPWALPPTTTAPLNAALDTGALSLRGYDRSLRLAWTLSDLRGGPRPSADDVLTAVTLRDGQVAA